MPTKAVAAGGTTALAGAITTVLLSFSGHPLSPDTAQALTTIISAVLTFAATWAVRAEGGVS